MGCYLYLVVEYDSSIVVLLNTTCSMHKASTYSFRLQLDNYPVVLCESEQASVLKNQQLHRFCIESPGLQVFTVSISDSCTDRVANF